MKISERLEFTAAFSLGSLRLCVSRFLARAKSRKVRFTIMIFTLALISLSAFFINSYRSYAKIVDARLARGYLISRAGIYAAPRTLRSGQRLSPEALAVALRRAGYLDDENASEIWNGSFSIRDAAVEIRPNNSGGFPSVLRVS